MLGPLMSEHAEHLDPGANRAKLRPRRARHQHEGLDDLSFAEIAEAYRDKYQPIITLKEAAEIARLAPNTIKTRMSRYGHFSRSAKKGKPLLFWRDRFILEVMGG
jgi:hypothetical protein